MNFYAAIAAVLVVAALGEMAALIGIWFRFAIPRAPRLFHWLLLGPMLTGSAAALMMAWIFLTGLEPFLGLYVRQLAVAYVASEAATYWILVSYAAWWHLKGRRCPV